MLLPGHVPGDVEHQGAEPDNALRRGVSRPAGLTPAPAAADKFVAEREAKRLSGLDKAKHMRTTVGDAITVVAKGAIKRRGRGR